MNKKIIDDLYNALKTGRVYSPTDGFLTKSEIGDPPKDGPDIVTAYFNEAECIPIAIFFDEYEKEKELEEKNDLENDHIHNWFELSYANYLTVPRSVMEAMPKEWQKRMTECLDELDNTIDWRPKEGRYYVYLRDDKGQFCSDPLSNYRHPVKMCFKNTGG